MNIYLQKKNQQIVVEKNTQREREKPIMHTKHGRTMRMDCHTNTASLLEYFAERVSDWIFIANIYMCMDRSREVYDDDDEFKDEMKKEKVSQLPRCLYWLNCLFLW